MKTVEEINRRIREGKAVVMTAEEFKKAAESGLSPQEVDVVTCATCALMSGTFALLSIPVAERGKFEKAEKVWLNGVPAFPGPCPNERLGIVEAIVYGTSRSELSPGKYGGGHLFRELVEGKEVEVEVRAGGKKFMREVRLEEMELARIFTSRSAFRNYMAFVHGGKGRVKTIFSVLGLRGRLTEASVSGCGELNPLENDPKLLTVGIGTRILLNGAMGYIMGVGTRFSKEKPNLSLTADMKGMIPKFMGGFVTSAGPECITSVAMAIPVLNEEVFKGLKVRDEEVELPIADVRDRVPFEHTQYSKVWKGVDLKVEYLPSSCAEHKACPVERKCPTGAFRKGKGIDLERCFDCGTCIQLCPSSFRGKLGTLPVGNREVPITLRQSCRRKAVELAELLKKKILEGEFLLSEPLQPLGG
ncbi:MAG: methanogenesis marker 16 metalloprotein [Candidatus Hadarchaeales archaeon]